LQSEILWRQLNVLRRDTDSSWHGEPNFWLTLLQPLQRAIAPKQCQLIIDFATKPLACHAGAVTCLSFIWLLPHSEDPRVSRGYGFSAK
jgi:hypothetical protein